MSDQPTKAAIVATVNIDDHFQKTLDDLPFNKKRRVAVQNIIDAAMRPEREAADAIVKEIESRSQVRAVWPSLVSLIAAYRAARG